MSNQPSPTPEQIRAARESLGLTQTGAAAVIGHTLRGWQDWEGGRRRMHPVMWRAWLHLAGIERMLFTPQPCADGSDDRRERPNL
jgi:hypothetical protein